MRYAIMSDIHANPEALKSALDDAGREGAESVICLGDVVGYGPEPVEAVSLCRSSCDVVLMGNHDAAVAGRIGTGNFIPFAQEGVRRHRAELPDEDRAWLNGLRYQYAARSFMCVHGTLDEPERFFYMSEPAPIVSSLEKMAAGRRRLLFVGHTHHACVIVCSRERRIRAFDPAGKLVLEPGSRYIVNVGSVGYPRVDHDITYVLYDTSAKTVSFRRLPFDHAAYARRLEERGVGLPLWLADCIRPGSKDGGR